MFIPNGLDSDWNPWANQRAEAAEGAVWQIF